MNDDSLPSRDVDSALESPELPRRRPDETQSEPATGVSGGDAYRIVTDLVVGPNVRWRDNLFQGLFILVSLVLATAVGAFWGVEGAIIGALGGLIGGLLLSGAVLGIYRAYRHARGRHD